MLCCWHQRCAHAAEVFQPFAIKVLHTSKAKLQRSCTADTIVSLSSCTTYHATTNTRLI